MKSFGVLMVIVAMSFLGFGCAQKPTTDDTPAVAAEQKAEASAADSQECPHHKDGSCPMHKDGGKGCCGGHKTEGSCPMMKGGDCADCKAKGMKDCSKCAHMGGDHKHEGCADGHCHDDMPAKKKKAKK